MKSIFSELQRCHWHPFSCCCFRNLRNSPKIRTYSSSRSSKVIDLGVNRKLICNFLLVINSNYMDVSLTVFEILTHLARKWLVFPTPPLFDAPSGGTPCDIDVIYTPLKSTFNGLQFCCWHYRSIFIRLAVVGRHLSFILAASSLWSVFVGHSAPR